MSLWASGIPCEDGGELGIGSSTAPLEIESLKQAKERLEEELAETVAKAMDMIKERDESVKSLVEEIEIVKDQNNKARERFDSSLYKQKIAMEALDHQNDLYAMKIAELEEKLAQRRTQQ